MTIIAYRNRVLASDTSIMNGYNIHPYGMRKIAEHHGCLAGAAGMATYCAAFLRWFEAGEQGEPPPATKDDGNYDSGLIVRPDGTLNRFEVGGWLALTPEYYAMGSGRDHAIGAFFVGADAETAVRAAIKHDPGSAGDVVALRL